MKILQLIQKPQLRGAEIFASQLGNHLIHQGHSCIMVSIFDGTADLPFSGEHIRLARPLEKRLWDLRGWKQLAEIVRREKPDLVQTNAGDTLKFAVTSKLLFRWDCPVVFRNANKIGDFIDSAPKYLLNRFFVGRVDHVISVSELCRTDFIDTFRFDHSKVTCVPIGIETNRIGPVPQDLSHVFADGPVVVNVASLVPEKNHAGLLRIFSKIISEFPTAQLLLIGGGRLKSDLQEYAKSLSLEKSVHFLGNRQDVLPIVAASRVFVLPSLIEGLPGVILEAMYCRVPVVAYDVGGIPEVLRNSETGWLIPKNDEDTFARAVKEVVVNHEKNTPVLERAYAHVVSSYNNDAIASRFISIYKQLF